MRPLTKAQIEALEQAMSKGKPVPASKVATLLGLHRLTVYKWLDAGIVAGTISGRKRYVDVAQLLKTGLPQFARGPKLKPQDARSIRARQKRGEDMLSVYADYRHLISLRSFKAIWRSKTY